MKVLFIHQNFPAQYRHIAAHLSRQGGHALVAVAKTTAGRVAGVRHIQYHIDGSPQRSLHQYVSDFETKVLHGEMVRDVLADLKGEGFTPDVVLAHPGWGEALFVRDVYPDAPRLDYCEFYYNAHGADVNFDPEQPPADDDTARIRSKNASALISLDSCDWGLSPTWWQRGQYPASYRPKISVLHDGIDTDKVKPNARRRLTLPDGVTVSRDDEVVTFVARNLEPYRGFHQFVRAAKLILERRPNVHILVVGGDGVSYGRKPTGDKTYRELMLEQVPLDPARVRFVGRLAYDQYLKVLQISSAHIYLTVPFVLSWSMLEAMAAGCVVLGSDTPPVAEVIEDGHNGLLVDYFSPASVADAVDRVLDHPDRMAALRRAARRTARQRYALSECLPRHIALIEDLAHGHVPPPSMTGQARWDGGAAAAPGTEGPLVVAPTGMRTAFD